MEHRARRTSHHLHIRHSVALHYPRSAMARVWEFFLLPACIVVGLFLIVRYSGLFHETLRGVSFGDVVRAAWYTSLRLFVAYLLALVASLPLALLATRSAVAQKVLLPLFDILQSVPVLAFFPIVIILFINAGLTEGAAVFILFLTMLWSLVFALIGGVGLIPRDIADAAEVFGIKGLAYARRIIVPAVVPQAVVGSILALAQGWNIIIVAEVVRTYLPPDSGVQNLYGLGSMLVAAAAGSDNNLFLAALGASVLIIALVNFFVWQKLLKYAGKFKFEQ